MTQLRCFNQDKNPFSLRTSVMQNWLQANCPGFIEQNKWPQTLQIGARLTITSVVPCCISTLNSSWSLGRLMSWKSLCIPFKNSCVKNTSTKRWRTSPTLDYLCVFIRGVCRISTDFNCRIGWIEARSRGSMPEVPRARVRVLGRGCYHRHNKRCHMCEKKCMATTFGLPYRTVNAHTAPLQPTVKCRELLQRGLGRSPGRNVFQCFLSITE